MPISGRPDAVAPEVRSTGRGRRRVLRAVAVVAAIAGADAVALGVWQQRHQGEIAAASSLGAVPDGSGAVADSAEPGPPPSSIEIPRIGVRSELDALRLGIDGSINPPGEAKRAGWWSQGTAPGENGAAIIVGHVDSYKGPGVFLRLRELQPRDLVVVHRNDGTSVSFTVDAIRQYRKNELPAELVYGPTAQASLRLITCGGRFDRRHHHYSDNVVVFAHAVPGPAA